MTSMQMEHVCRGSHSSHRCTPGTKGAMLDMDSAFRRVPIKPDQQPTFIVCWDGKVYIDHTGPFFPSSSLGVFGRLADMVVDIYKSKGIAPIKKCDDSFFFDTC